MPKPALPTGSPTVARAGSSLASRAGKVYDLAVLGQGVRDYLSFVDETKELFFAYLYHRTGSVDRAFQLMVDVYLEVLSRSLSFLWRKRLTLRALLNVADRVICDMQVEVDESDVDAVYVPALAWVKGPREKEIAGHLHETLWTLSAADQRMLALSLLLGLDDEHIAQMEGLDILKFKEHLELSRQRLLKKWDLGSEMRHHLSSLAFLPSLSLSKENELRFAVIEKYIAQKARRFQWVVLAVVLAVLSNAFVASVLALTVIIKPASSLHSVRSEVASLDAVILKRERESADPVRQSLSSLSRGKDKLLAYGAASDLHDLALIAVSKELSSYVRQEAEIEKTIRILEARTAYEWQVSLIARALLLSYPAAFILHR